MVQCQFQSILWLLILITYIILNLITGHNQRDFREAAVPGFSLEQLFGTISKFQTKHQWQRILFFQKKRSLKHLLHINSREHVNILTFLYYLSNVLSIKNLSLSLLLLFRPRFLRCVTSNFCFIAIPGGLLDLSCLVLDSPHK